MLKLLLLCNFIYGHSGRTDSKGGHSSSSGYHYHNSHQDLYFKPEKYKYKHPPIASLICGPPESKKFSSLYLENCLKDLDTSVKIPKYRDDFRDIVNAQREIQTELNIRKAKQIKKDKMKQPFLIGFGAVMSISILLILLT